MKGREDHRRFLAENYIRKKIHQTARLVETTSYTLGKVINITNMGLYDPYINRKDMYVFLSNPADLWWLLESNTCDRREEMELFDWRQRQ